jgi:rubredoxin
MLNSTTENHTAQWFQESMKHTGWWHIKGSNNVVVAASEERRCDWIRVNSHTSCHGITRSFYAMESTSKVASIVVVLTSIVIHLPQEDLADDRVHLPQGLRWKIWSISPYGEHLPPSPPPRTPVSPLRPLSPLPASTTTPMCAAKQKRESLDAPPNGLGRDLKVA